RTGPLLVETTSVRSRSRTGSAMSVMAEDLPSRDCVRLLCGRGSRIFRAQSAGRRKRECAPRVFTALAERLGGRVAGQRAAQARVGAGVVVGDRRRLGARAAEWRAH